MDIPKIIKEHHQAMIDKGFYPEGEEKNIRELLMLIVSELGEALEAHRQIRFSEWYYVDKWKLGSSWWNRRFEVYIKDTFEDEIADILLRIFDLCGYLEIDLDHECRLMMNKDFNVAETLFTATSYICEFGLNKNNISMLNFSYGVMMSISEKMEIDIEKHIEAKMAYNKTRPHKHGKEY